MLRIYRGGWSPFGDPSILDTQDAIRRLHQRQVVGGNQQANLGLVGGVAQQRGNGAPGHGVEIAGGFVG